MFSSSDFSIIEVQLLFMRERVTSILITPPKTLKGHLRKLSAWPVVCVITDSDGVCVSNCIVLYIPLNAPRCEMLENKGSILLRGLMW